MFALFDCLYVFTSLNVSSAIPPRMHTYVIHFLDYRKIKACNSSISDFTHKHSVSHSKLESKFNRFAHDSWIIISVNNVPESKWLEEHILNEQVHSVHCTLSIQLTLLMQHIKCTCVIILFTFPTWIYGKH